MKQVFSFNLAALTHLMGWVLGLFLPLLSPAQKTDTITLVNQEKVVGELKSLVDGKLTLDTKYLGKVTIEWDDIVSVWSDKMLEIQHHNLRIYRGTLQPGPRDSMLVIEDEETGRIVAPIRDIVRIDQLKRSFWGRFGGYLDAGLSYTKASDVTQLTFDGALRYKYVKYFSELSFSSITTRQGADSTKARVGDLSLDLNRIFATSWYIKVFFSGQRNSELGIRFRTLAGGGVGRDMLRTPLTNLFFTVGLTSNQETYEEDQGKKSSMEGLAAIQFKSFRYDIPELDLTSSIAFWPSITERGRYRAELSLKARVEIIDDFYVSLSVYDNFDNQPPEGANRNDWGIVTSVGYSF